MSIIVESGITSSGCIVQSDTMEVYGSAVQTTVNGGGYLYVSSGGAASGTTINGEWYAGGSMTICVDQKIPVVPERITQIEIAVAGDNTAAFLESTLAVCRPVKTASYCLDPRAPV